MALPEGWYHRNNVQKFIKSIHQHSFDVVNYYFTICSSRKSSEKEINLGRQKLSYFLVPVLTLTLQLLFLKWESRFGDQTPTQWLEVLSFSTWLHGPNAIHQVINVGKSVISLIFRELPCLIRLKLDTKISNVFLLW